MNFQRVCRTQNTNARQQWEEVLSHSLAARVIDRWEKRMETPGLSAGHGSSSLSIFLLQSEPEIQQAPEFISKEPYTNTRTYIPTPTHVITTPFYLNLLLFFTKIIQKRETGIFTKIHGWYST